MLEYKDKIIISRRNTITGDLTQIYNNIEADIQINYRKNIKGQNSNNSEVADFFIFTKKENNNIKVGDLIFFNNYFGESVILQVLSKDLIDFENIEPFIEVLCKLI